MGKRPLLGVDNLLGLQDNGYKSTVSAIAELIDNSIQANAKNVDIVIIKNTTKDSDEIDEILIIDDGDGMDEKKFQKALQMSSGSNFGSNHGLGRYGQGLPNSSISQTKRVEVYSYKDKSKILYDRIDLHEIYDSGEAFLPDMEIREKIDIPLISDGKIKTSDSGTIVRWVKPNRVKPKTARSLAQHIHWLAGRMFRYFIEGFHDSDGKFYKSKINIIVYEFNGSNYAINEHLTIRDIKPFDPMFLMSNTQMDDIFNTIPHPTNTIYLAPGEIKKTFQAEDQNGDLIDTVVEISISYCKPEIRREFGRSAGSTEFGKKYLNRNIPGNRDYNNISIVRAGRELDSGTFGFIGDVSDPRNRWWSAEIKFDPVLDSIVGVDNKKQHAVNIKYYGSDVEKSDDDIDNVVAWISETLKINIDTVMGIIKKQNATIDPGINVGGTPVLLPPGGSSEFGDPAIEDGTLIDDEEKMKIRNDLFIWIKERYGSLEDAEIYKMADYALQIDDYHIFVKSDLGDTNLYSYKVFGTKVLIEINYNHSFYDHFISHFEENSTDEKSLRSLRLLISAMVNAEIVNNTQDKELIRDRRSLRNRMSESLDKYIDKLYSV
jgi:hypothetical protein